MYIAQANNGKFKIVKSLGVIDPKEGNVPVAVEYASMSAVGLTKKAALLVGAACSL